ncbi:MAG: pseudouridine synthase [Acidobacteriota bacterium]
MPSVAKPPAGDRPLKTLERVLSKAGVGSRRESRSIVAAGRVRVNEVVELDPDRWVDLERDSFSLDDLPLTNAELVYVVLHKPSGVLTTLRDKEERRTIYDLLPENLRTLRYVGRLDMDTTGVLLLTNDHALAERMTNPAFKVPKTYRVHSTHPITPSDIKSLIGGIELSDGVTRPADVQPVTADGCVVDITITEGRNRQVRRMLEALGNEAMALERIAFGPIRLDSLKEGEYRQLTDEEVAACLGTSSQDQTAFASQ